MACGRFEMGCSGLYCSRVVGGFRAIARVGYGLRSMYEKREKMGLWAQEKKQGIWEKEAPKFGKNAWKIRKLEVGGQRTVGMEGRRLWS